MLAGCHHPSQDGAHFYHPSQPPHHRKNPSPSLCPTERFISSWLHPHGILECELIGGWMLWLSIRVVRVTCVVDWLPWCWALHTCSWGSCGRTWGTFPVWGQQQWSLWAYLWPSWVLPRSKCTGSSDLCVFNLVRNRQEDFPVPDMFSLAFLLDVSVSYFAKCLF
jgi:hypothetical protein